MYNNKKVLFGIGFFVIFLYYLPYFIFGPNAKIFIHDNLEANIVWVKILLDNNAVFNAPDFIIHKILGGIPRSSIYSFYDIGILWFHLFGMYWGYVFSKLVMSSIAFLGMILLLPELTKKYENTLLISGFMAILFALLPFWSINLSIAGLPLVSFAFLNIRNRESKIGDYMIIIIYAFYSSLILIGFFYLLILFVIFVIDYYKQRSFNKPFFFAIFLLSFFYIISHYPLFYSFLLTTYKSHRSEFSLPPIGVNAAADEFIKILAFGQYHAQSLHTFFIPFILLAIVLQVKSKNFDKLFFGILIFIVITSILYAINHFEFFYYFFQWLMDIIPIQLQRFHFLHPMLWIILFTISLLIIKREIKYWYKIVIAVAFSLNFLFIIKNHELIVNRNSVSFKEFYAKQQFDDIKTFIGTDFFKYKTISVGMHPSVAQYNNFMTLDGYFADYPLIHKKQFRKIIKGELEKSEYLSANFNNWGSRCYAFSSELRGFRYYKGNNENIQQMDYNFSHYKSMGGKYIISAVKINENKDELKFLNKFENDDSAWDIYLYEVLDSGDEVETLSLNRLQ